jgi:hypothetical protein
MWPFARKPVVDDETAAWHVDNFAWHIRQFGGAAGRGHLRATVNAWTKMSRKPLHFFVGA